MAPITEDSENVTTDDFSYTTMFSQTRAKETSNLLNVALDQLVPFISAGDQERAAHSADVPLPEQSTSLIKSPFDDSRALQSKLSQSLMISDEGSGVNGFKQTLKDILDHSVNPMAPGFLDKLYSSPLPPGVAAELILSILNANLHVYHVSPVLSSVEKSVTKKLAMLFGLRGSRAGGVSMQGGSASNLTSIVTARNSLYPETKVYGNSVNGRKLVLFTSAHGHYSIEKSAQALGFGSSAVITVPTDTLGRMRSDELERLIIEAKAQGSTPFYVNATAGTTVLGSFDPFEEISIVAKKYRCWFHIDGAWGGSYIFSKKKAFCGKLEGCHLADSIAINPHKMLGVPLTCSFLLVRDLRLLHQAMTLKAGYLFHEPEDDSNGIEDHTVEDESTGMMNGINEGLDGSGVSFYDMRDDDGEWTEPDDLGDMTLQCGRRGDSLKLFMSWQYYGTAGYAKKIEDAYDVASHLNNLVDSNSDLTLVLGPGSVPSCLQVCFYYTPGGEFLYGLKAKDRSNTSPTAVSAESLGKQNTKVTSRISKALVSSGFMIDFAPALDGQSDRGSFLRVVVNISTVKETADRLIVEVLKAGNSVVKQLRGMANGQSGGHAQPMA